MAKRKVKPELFLVPKEIREEFAQVALCVNVWLPPDRLDELSRLCELGDKFTPKRFHFAARSAADKSVAVVIQTLKSKPGAVHVTVECRPEQEAPHRAVPKTRMQKLYRLLKNHATKTELAHWEQSVVIPPPVGDRLFTRPKGARVHLRVLEFDIVEPETGERSGASSVSIERVKEGVLFRMWSGARRRLQNVDEAFKVGPMKADELRPGLTGPGDG